MLRLTEPRSGNGYVAENFFPDPEFSQHANFLVAIAAPVPAGLNRQKGRYSAAIRQSRPGSARRFLPSLNRTAQGRATAPPLSKLLFRIASRICYKAANAR